MKKSFKNRRWSIRSVAADNIKDKSVTSGFITTAGQGFSFILTLTSTIVLARLLSPKDYGLVAMVTSFTGIVLLLKDLGMATAVIQREEVSQRQLNSVFWINIVVGIVLSLIIIGLSPLIAMFYKDDRLIAICMSYSVSAFFGCASVLHTALLDRHMKFKNRVIVQIVAQLLGVAIGILMALNGAGYWSLVIMNISIVFFTFVSLWFLCDWRPYRFEISKKVTSMVKFGVGVTGFNLINYFSRNTDKMIIGRLMGEGLLGIYDKAYQLLMLPITQLRNPLTSVGVPALSTLINDPVNYRSYYRKYVFILAFMTMPLVAYMGIYSEGIILFFLGAKWIMAGKVFAILALSAFIQPVAGTRGLVLISYGYSRRYFIWGIANAVFVVLGFVIGAKFGIEGVAASYAIVNYLILIPSLLYCFRSTTVRLVDFLAAIKFPALYSVIAGGTTWALDYWGAFSFTNVLFFKLAFTSICHFALYIVLYYSNIHSRSAFGNVDAIYKILRKKVNKKS